jgi:hypothetical protein
MSSLQALLKKGFQLGKKVEGGVELLVPNELTSSFGKKIVVADETLKGAFGKTLRAEKSSTTLPEMYQAFDQQAIINKETQLPITLEDSVDPLEKIRRDKELAAVQHRPAHNDEFVQTRQNIDDSLKRKVMKASAIAAPSVDMNPLEDIKAGYEAYRKVKDTIAEAAANQMDLTKDKSATADIKGVLSTLGDPTNYVPGAPGVALGALQMGLDALPESKLKALFNKRGQ